MSGLWFLFAGFALVWLLLGGYVLVMARRQAALRRELERLRLEMGGAAQRDEAGDDGE